MWRIWVSALLWGLNWPAVKLALAGFSPWTLRAVGLGLGAVLLAALAKAMRRPLAVPAGHRTALVIAAFLSVAGFNICAVFAQLAMPTSRAAILTFTMPLWAALFAALFAGERIDSLRAAALVCGAAGLALLAKPYWPALAEGSLPAGLVLVLGAAISWAAGTVYTKRRRLPGDPLGLAAWQLGIGAAFAGAGAIAFEAPRIDLSSAVVAGAFAYHVVLALALAYLLWFQLLERVPSATAALGTLLIPVFALAGSIVLLGEQPMLADLAGFGLIILGVGLDQGLRSLRAPLPGGAGKPMA
ncbi:MAG: DMT family transporter [Hyphomicrobiaceae bacterium]|nr:DMT family transporter [Hyphomicrobiaceae bacterium]